jgi:hypothetical protein
VTDKGPDRFLPTGVQKSYIMLSDAERTVLNTALGKYQPGQSEPILVGGKNLLKPALRLMTAYRLANRGDQGFPSDHELHPVGGCRAGQRSGKSGSLPDL